MFKVYKTSSFLFSAYIIAAINTRSPASLFNSHFNVIKTKSITMSDNLKFPFSFCTEDSFHKCKNISNKLLFYCLKVFKCCLLLASAVHVPVNALSLRKRKRSQWINRNLSELLLQKPHQCLQTNQNPALCSAARPMVYRGCVVASYQLQGVACRRPWHGG